MSQDQSKAMQKFIEGYLSERGIASKDGIAGPTCQTGEEYTEFTIHGRGIVTLTQAACGLIAGFGKSGDTCYWRTKADYDDRPGHEGVYIRFKCTAKTRQEQAA